MRAIAEALFVTESAVKQHLDRLYDKFAIFSEPGVSRRVLLANEAIQTAAVTMRDLRPPTLRRRAITRRQSSSSAPSKIDSTRASTKRRLTANSSA